MTATRRMDTTKLYIQLISDKWATSPTTRCTESWSDLYKPAFGLPRSSTHATRELRSICLISTQPRVSSRSPTLPRKLAKAFLEPSHPTAKAISMAWRTTSWGFSRRQPAVGMPTQEHWQRRHHPPMLLCSPEAKMIRPRSYTPLL